MGAPRLPPTRLLLAWMALALASCGEQEPGAFAPAGSVSRRLGSLTLLLVVLGSAVFALVLILAVRAAREAGAAAHHAESEVPDTDVAATRRARRLVLGGGVALPVVVLVPLTVVMVLTSSAISNRQGPVGLEVEVIGHQYWWEVRYPDLGVVTANEIHLPVDTPIRMTVTSADVIHSIWVPQLAGKIDLIPGKVNELRFDVEQPGTYEGVCAEFCGLQHARMRFLVIAQWSGDFERWAESQARPAAEPPSDQARAGAEVFARYGCGECHRVEGTDADGTLGPDLTHLASRRTLGARTIPNERGHLAGWVVDPQSVKPGNLMPPTPIGSEELLDLVAYLESLE